MITKEITLKSGVSNSVFSSMCEYFEEQKIFQKSYIKNETKIIVVSFENDIDYLAWCAAMGFCVIKDKI